MRVLSRSILFAAVTSLISLVADIALSFTGGSPSPQTQNATQALQALYHAAIFALTLLGAAAGFGLIRAHLPSLKRTGLMACVYGIVAVFAGSVGYMIAGYAGMAAWALLAPMGIAYWSGRMRKPKV